MSARPSRMSNSAGDAALLPVSGFMTNRPLPSWLYNYDWSWPAYAVEVTLIYPLLEVSGKSHSHLPTGGEGKGACGRCGAPSEPVEAEE